MRTEQRRDGDRPSVGLRQPFQHAGHAVLETALQPPPRELAVQGEAPEMEWVALGDGSHRRQQLRLRMANPGRREIGGHRLGREGAQADGRRVALQIREQLLDGRPETRIGVAARQHHQHGNLAPLPGEEAGEEERGRVRQMDVVEHEDDREPCGAGRAGDRARPGNGRSARARARRRAPRGDPRAPPISRRIARHGQRGGASPSCQHRPMPTRAPRRRARSRDLLGQAGLADPGRALDHGDLALAPPGGGQHLHELGELGGPSHERRQCRSARTGHGSSGGAVPPRGTAASRHRR